ncbi:MAG: hypothetical protein ACPK7O_05165 [Methanobacterium sp.]
MNAIWDKFTAVNKRVIAELIIIAKRMRLTCPLFEYRREVNAYPGKKNRSKKLEITLVVPEYKKTAATETIASKIIKMSALNNLFIEISLNDIN